MKRKLFIALALLLAALTTILLWPLKSDDFRIKWDAHAMKEKQDFLASVPPKTREESLPNVLLILVDDLGVHDISYYGSKNVSTPHIDSIALLGVAFNQAYCASPVCSPARASLLTGRYPQRFGFEFQMHDRYLANRLEYYGFKYLVPSEPWHPQSMHKVPMQDDVDLQGLPPSEITIAEMLRSRGYATALVGKWHLGWDEQNKPCRFGFDYQYGFYDSHSLYAPVGTPGITDQKIKGDFTDKYMWSDGRNGPKGIFRDCLPVDEREHLTDAITRESIAFIRNHKDGPWFLLAAYNAPLTPLQAPDEYVELFNDETDPVKRVYHAMIRHLDDNIGKLLAELSRQGQMENTLVIFLSDNGGATYTRTTDNGPLRGGKITDFEGGLRVPFFMHWKGRISPGSTNPHPVIGMDVFSTIAVAAKCPLPENRTIDGKNLLGENEQDSIASDRHLCWQRGNSRAIRSGDWKVMWNEEFTDTLMYNITQDPYETLDLYAENRSRALELIKVHQEWSGSLPGPLWPPIVHFREQVDGRWFYFDS